MRAGACRSQWCLVSFWVAAAVTSPLAHPQACAHPEQPCWVRLLSSFCHSTKSASARLGSEQREVPALLNTVVDLPTVPAVLVVRKKAVQNNIGLLMRGISKEDCFGLFQPLCFIPNG